MELKGIEALVYEQLMIDPATRNSDVILYTKVCEKINPSATKLPFSTALLKSNELDLPKWESVSRCRRRLQEKNPCFRASKEVEEGRFRRWKDYRLYVEE